MRRLALIALGLAVLGALVSGMPGSPAFASAASAQSCRFVLGFASLRELIPSVVGECLADVAYDSLGNGSQHTTKGMMQWRRADNWTAFSNGHQTWVNGPYGLEVRLNSQRFPWEANPQGLPVADDGTPLVFSGHLDDRTTPVSLLTSYVNALNRREYLRAYSYWERDAAAAQLGTYDQFRQDNAGTVTVQLGTGTVGGLVEPYGNLYYTVPASLTIQNAAGSFETLAGCYTLHLVHPAEQAAPPFRGLSIQAADMQAVPSGVDVAEIMDQACQAPGIRQTSPAPPEPDFHPADVSAARYLDDRSDPIQVIRSFYNAINHREFTRAYTYWEVDSAHLGTFNQFVAGHANTEWVALTLGTVAIRSDTREVFHSVPVSLIVQANDGTSQTLVGCYTLHQARADAQMVPPFQPLGLRAASFRQVPDAAAAAGQLGSICLAP